VSPDRRIGDYIARTKLVNSDPIRISFRTIGVDWRKEMNLDMVKALSLSLVIGIGSFILISLLP
jgi:hypothetical protein